jgi:hypothetical protein
MDCSKNRQFHRTSSDELVPCYVHPNRSVKFGTSFDLEMLGRVPNERRQ